MVKGGACPIPDGFQIAPTEQKMEKERTMLNVQANVSDATVAAVAAHAANRSALLASCVRGANAAINSATRWARAELMAMAAGLTTREEVQRAVCEKFPLVTANGKVSKTPNSGFKTSFDKFVLLADVLEGTSKTYGSPSAKKLADSFFMADSKLTLNDVVDQIKADKAAASREASANETDEQKTARKAKEAASQVETLAGTVVNDGAVMLALARRIDEMDASQCLAFDAPLTALILAAERAIGRSLDAQREAIAIAAADKPVAVAA